MELAEAYGDLTTADVIAFVEYFDHRPGAADLAEPIGIRALWAIGIRFYRRFPWGVTTSLAIR